MPILIVILGIVSLLIFILVFKFNSFLSFIIVSLGVGLAEGMPFEKALTSLENGIGNTLGFLVMILGFGAMLGKLVAESGAAQKITLRLIQSFGEKNVQLAVMLTGFIVGVPLFYEVGFVLLVPLVFTIAASTRLPLIYVGLPMLASLSVTHGYLPPHPAPTAIAAMFHADIGLTLLYGIIIAIPAIIIAGPILSRTMTKIEAKPMKEFVNQKILTDSEMPGLAISILVSLLPVLLIGLSSLVHVLIPGNQGLNRILLITGNPIVAMLVSVLVAIYALGIRRGRKIAEIMESMTHSISSLTIVMLILAGAGTLKQVLVDSGVSTYIGSLLTGSSLSPLFLAWLIATTLRVCVGSATVAGITTAGIVLPLASSGTVHPELLVLAIGSGSLMLSHVNDGGFWLIKEYFNLSVKETLRSWTLMETSIGLTGLAGVLILNLIV
jgi:Gnt-I system high-affinity gluconate transporter